MSALNIIEIGSNEYLESLAKRVTEDRIQEMDTFTMMFRAKKIAGCAFKAIVEVDGINNESYDRTLVHIEFKDPKDFIPQIGMECGIQLGILTPTDRQLITVQKKFQTPQPITEAYLIDYDDGLNDDAIKNSIAITKRESRI